MNEETKIKATDFNLSKEIQFLPEQGLVVHKDARLLILDSNSLGLLLNSLIVNMGFENTMKTFMQSGFEHGFSDFLAMQADFGDKFENEIELFASGPVIHSWEGLVHAQPTKIEIDREKGHFLCEGIWTNSWQAQQYLTFNPVGEKAVCSSLTGYASGWTSGFFGEPVLAIETACIAKGDPHCAWQLKPIDNFGEEAAYGLNMLKDQFDKFKKIKK
ncbi:MAG: XylR N-terminal domain-containing protein [bacterium]